MPIRAIRRPLPRCLRCDQYSTPIRSNDARREMLTLRCIRDDVAAIHQSISGGSSCEGRRGARWARGGRRSLLSGHNLLVRHHCSIRPGSTRLMEKRDLRVYLTGSASAGAGSPAPSGPRIFRSASLAISAHRSQYPLAKYSRQFERTNPLVPPLYF